MADLVIKINDKEIYRMNETRQKVLKNDLLSESFNEDIERRTAYVLEHKYEQCYARLKKEWEPKLIKAGIDSFPSDADKFAELVFAQPHYKNRSSREENV